MKSSLTFYIGISVVASVLLAGCGQPGPLYLPKLPPKSKPASAPATPATPAVPGSGSSTAPERPPTDDNAVQPSTIIPPVLPQ